eukprot:TRINITY_DN62985_c0_g1_i1.p1 TRINITY_DN62985_c0_g1~~TRINITY_DN62985_c0_g1_i1.p1  ORF type:complete len:251 (-),score=77.78 TRINITY_DN62985_c0_g1_i1:9-761(-)
MSLADFPLLLAAQSGNTDHLAEALSANADPDCHGDDGITPLMLAAFRNDAGMCHLLLEAKADIQLQDQNGLTSLMHGALSGSVEVCFTLLEASASVDTADRTGRSALIHAVDACDDADTDKAAQHQTLCGLLLKQRANIDHQDENGCTPLLLASIAGSSALLPLLVSGGANLALRDKFGNSALEYAQAEGHDLASALLSAAGRANSARLENAEQRKRYETSLAACTSQLKELEELGGGQEEKEQEEDEEQ